MSHQRDALDDQDAADTQRQGESAADQDPAGVAAEDGRDSIADAVSAIRAGPNSAAEQKLFDEFWKRVHGFVQKGFESRVIGASDIANEVLNLFFEKVRRDGERKFRFNNRDCVFAFLATVARRNMKDKWKSETGPTRCPPGGVGGESRALEDSHGNRLALGEGGERSVPLVYQELTSTDREEFAREFSDALLEIEAALLDDLTENERKLAECKARGLSNRETAEELDVSETTIDNRIARIRHKIRNAAKKGRLHVPRNFVDGS